MKEVKEVAGLPSLIVGDPQWQLVRGLSGLAFQHQGLSDGCQPKTRPQTQKIKDESCKRKFIIFQLAVSKSKLTSR